MYESKEQAILSRKAFCFRVAQHFFAVTILFAGSIVIGMLGLMLLEAQSWHDAFMHSTLLLGGMGAASLPGSTAGKIFVGLFGMYAGLVFIVAAGMLVAPFVHRVLHSFHLDGEEG